MDSDPGLIELKKQKKTMKNIFILILLFISVIGFSQNANTPTTGGGAADGTETIITAGTNVTVTGTGASGTPYVINSTGSSTVTTSAVAAETPFTNPPAAPVEGDTYVNSADVLSWVFDGTTWQVTSFDRPEAVTINAITTQTPFTNPPSSPVEGDEFLNTVDNLQWVYDGATWIPRPVPSTSPTYSSAVIAAPYTGVELPVAAGTVVGQVRTQQFNDGQTVDYTWSGAAWVAGVVIDVTEQRICLNTATPVFTPANLLSPTLAEVTAWVTASTLTDVQKLNGTHLDYFIAGQGGSCDNPDYTWVLNEGSLLTTRVDNSILTLPDYTALRALTGYNHDVVAVDDFTYVGPDGNTYTTRGGIFKRDLTVNTFTENGGTYIVGTDGTKWERDWDKLNVKPEWWVCGGYDVYGKIYTDKNTISVDANIGNDEVFHAGIYNDRDRIQAAIDCRQPEGLQNYTINVHYEKREYSIDKNMSRYNPTSQDKSGTDEYNFATIKRATTSSTTLAVAMNIGNTTITVANASTYRVGMKLSILNAAATYAGLGFDESAVVYITGIAGNVITLKAAATVARPLGSIVIPEITLIDNKTLGVDGSIVIYKNGHFNGNKLNGGGQRYTQDWRFNGCIFAGTGTDNTTVENCHFYDTPGENIYLSQGFVSNCTGTNLDGSFVHISMNNIKYATELTTGVHIDNCKVNGVCLATDAVSGHCESAIVNSLHTEKIYITNCMFENGSEAVFAMDIFQTNTKGGYTVNASEFKNFKYIVEAIGTGTVNQSTREDFVTVTNNVFDNCGRFLIWGHQAEKGLSVNGINVSNNIFYDTRFSFRHCNNVKLSNNQILFHADRHVDFTTRPFPQGLASVYAAIDLLRVKNVSIDGNHMEGFEVLDEEIAVAINLNLNENTRLKDAAGVNLNYYWEQDIHITNNKMIGFLSGITGLTKWRASASATVGNLYSVVNWNFSNNTFVHHKTLYTYPVANTRALGIGCPPGAICNENTIIQTVADANFIGICAFGLGNNAGFPPKLDTDHIGAIVMRNIIKGFPGGAGNDIYGGNPVTGNTSANCMIVGNFITRPIGGTVATSYVNSNITIGTGILPSLTTPQPTIYNYFEMNKTQY
jgi:hypothetical protein